MHNIHNHPKIKEIWLLCGTIKEEEEIVDEEFKSLFKWSRSGNFDKTATWSPTPHKHIIVKKEEYLKIIEQNGNNKG